LESWMFRIARNMHIDMVRSNAVRGTVVNIDTVPDISGDDGLAIVEGRSDMAAVQTALARLPEEQRSLLALVVLNGASYRDAAEVLDIPIGTVMSRIARARRALDAVIHGRVA
jgi:RNA polymerase sigma-70 factor (ECF subfamily)